MHLSLSSFYHVVVSVSLRLDFLLCLIRRNQAEVCDPGERGVLPYETLAGTCSLIGYGFQGVLS